MVGEFGEGRGVLRVGRVTGGCCAGSLALLAAVCIAEPQEGQPVELPGGSWTIDAADPTMRGNNLCAVLRKRDGTHTESCIPTIPGQVYNNTDGNFEVVRIETLPRGGWQASARNIKREGDLLCAELRREDLTWQHNCIVIESWQYFENNNGNFRVRTQACIALDPCVHGYTLKQDVQEVFCELLICDAVRDRDTCCEPAMHCSNITTCPPNYLPDPNGYCPATTCDEDRDRDHCCVHAGRCSSMPMIEGYIHKPMAYDILCPTNLCTPDRDRNLCFDTAASCENMTYRTCPRIHGTNAAQYFDPSLFCYARASEGCDEAVDIDNCCLPSAACTNMTCPHGYLYKFNESFVYCDGPFCIEERDIQHCCDESMPCTNLTCPDRETQRLAEFCLGMQCIPERDTSHCCTPSPNCTELNGTECPLGYYFNEFQACDGEFCEEWEDRMICCQVAAPCSSLTCPHGKNYIPGYLNLYCNGAFCLQSRDEDLCCQSGAPCLDLTCPFGWTHRESAPDEYCLGPSCQLPRDLEQCCDHAANCTDHYDCPHGRVAKASAYCDGLTCDVTRDLEICCDVAMSCTAIPCPLNYVMRYDTYCPRTYCIYHSDVYHCCKVGLMFQYYRLETTAVRNMGPPYFNTIVQFSEFHLYYDEHRLDRTTMVASSSGVYPPYEAPEFALDGNPLTKFHVFNLGDFVIKLPEQAAVDAFTIETAFDESDRDPWHWNFWVSNDNANWLLVNAQTGGNAGMPIDRNTESAKYYVVVPCAEPAPLSILNFDAGNHTCQEGEFRESGTNCTTICQPGYTPSIPVLFCENGVNQPPIYECVLDA